MGGDIWEWMKVPREAGPWGLGRGFWNTHSRTIDGDSTVWEGGLREVDSQAAGHSFSEGTGTGSLLGRDDAAVGPPEIRGRTCSCKWVPPRDAVRGIRSLREASGDAFGA